MITSTVVPVREILVATDFSETSDAAVRVAHAYARAFGSRLHVFHVTWPEERAVTSMFARVLDELGRTVPVIMASHSGDAAVEIVRHAKECGADLIVVGTHGQTGFTRKLLGSVAERVTRTAPCPVLTVPPTSLAVEEPRPALPVAHRCLVCARESQDLICEPCRAHIRGEALEAKHREERAGRN